MENKFQDFGGLAKLRDELKNNEPIKENVQRTVAMLTSPVSKKLLKYFFVEYGADVDKYVKKDEARARFVERIKKVVSDGEELKPEDAFNIDNLFIRFIKKIPISESSNKGVVFGDLVNKAGCTGQEAEEAKKLLGSYIDPVLDSIFKR